MRVRPSTLTFGPSFRIIWTTVISRPVANRIAALAPGMTAERCRDARGLPEGVVLGLARPGTWLLQGTGESPRGQGPVFQRDLSARPSAHGPAHRGLSGAPVPGLRRGGLRPAGQPVARTRGPASPRPGTDRRGGSRPVEEGPVELKDDAQVTVDYAETDDLADDVEIVWDDEPAGQRVEKSVEPEPRADRPTGQAPAIRTTPERPQTKPTAAPNQGGEPTSTPSTETRGPASKRGRPARPAPRRPSRVAGRTDEPAAAPPSSFSPSALMVVGTVAFRTWMNRRQDLPRVAEVGKTEGIPALEAGEVRQGLSASLGGQGSGGLAGRGRRGRRGDPPRGGRGVDLRGSHPRHPREPARGGGTDHPAGLGDAVRHLYKGRAVIIDARIIATPRIRWIPSGTSSTISSSPRERARISATPPAAVPVMHAST